MKRFESPTQRHDADLPLAGLALAVVAMVGVGCVYGGIDTERERTEVFAIETQPDTIGTTLCSAHPTAVKHADGSVTLSVMSRLDPARQRVLDRNYDTWWTNREAVDSGPGIRSVMLFANGGRQEVDVPPQHAARQDMVLNEVSFTPSQAIADARVVMIEAAGAPVRVYGAHESTVRPQVFCGAVAIIAAQTAE